MSCKIIKERERVTKIDYSLEFDFGDGGGYTFPCDKDGNLEELNPCAQESYKWCLEHPERFCRKPFVQKYTWKYTEPAVAKCICGEEFELVDEYMGACECPKCGRWYNLFGQELIKPEYWSEGEDW